MKNIEHNESPDTEHESNTAYDRDGASIVTRIGDYELKTLG